MLDNSVQGIQFEGEDFYKPCKDHAPDKWTGFGNI